MRKLLIAFLCLCSSTASAIDTVPNPIIPLTDSLRDELNKAEDDSVHIEIIRFWINKIAYSDLNEQHELSLKIDSICNKNLEDSLGFNAKRIKFFKSQNANALSNIAVCAIRMDGDFEKAKIYLNKSLEIRRAINDYQGLGATLGNLGNLNFSSGNLNQALNNYLESIEFSTLAKDYMAVIKTQTNLGALYGQLNENEKSKEIYLEIIDKLMADSISKNEKHKINSLANAYANVGIIFRTNDQPTEALNYFSKAFELFEQNNDKSNVGRIYDELGKSYASLGLTQKAIENCTRSLEIFEELNYRSGECRVRISLCELHIMLKNYDTALNHGKIALALAEKENHKSVIADAARELSKVYKLIGNHELALKHYEKYIESRDLLEKEKTKKEFLQQKIKYEYEIKATADSIRAAKESEIKSLVIANQEAELSAGRNKQYLLFGGISFAMILSLISYSRYKTSNRQKKTIERQKFIVDEINKELTDSIRYAKRIQNAVLPPKSLLPSVFPNSFVLHQPKSIVGGDFYWILQKENRINVAVCDCTGHGVPGAMVSVICNNGLNRSIRVHNLSSPSAILKKTREIVIDEFNKSEEDIKDGMDVALCTITGNQLQYSGANRCLQIIRNNELIELKGDRQPIANYEHSFDFTNHIFELQKGDTLYMFSDGFASQFGGENGKKYKSGRLKSFLLSMCDKPMSMQRELLKREFYSWQGAEEQVDDICVLGIRF